MPRQFAWRKARHVPNSPRHIFIGMATNIAGMTVRDTLLAHSRRCPCSHHDPHPPQRPHNPISLRATLTAEETPERNVIIRHVSREIIGRDPPRLIFAEQLGRAACPHHSQKVHAFCTKWSQTNKTVKNCEYRGRTKRWC